MDGRINDYGRIKLSRQEASELRIMMRRAGVTQKKIAESLGISPLTVTRYMNPDSNYACRRGVPVHFLQGISTHFGIQLPSLTDRVVERVTDDFSYLTAQPIVPESGLDAAVQVFGLAALHQVHGC